MHVLVGIVITKRKVVISYYDPTVSAEQRKIIRIKLYYSKDLILSKAGQHFGYKWRR